MADWRLSAVPKYVTQEEVEQVLKACNRNTTIGRRDYAVLLLVARLGLRAGEVVALQLEDINGRAGEILVRGKGMLHERMPPPADVGEALAFYLRQDRPAYQTRHVFVCTKAPRRSFVRSCTVSMIIRRSLLRADLDPPVKGAHLFRHSLAASLLRSGGNRRSSSPSRLRHNGNLRQSRLRWLGLNGSLPANRRCAVNLEQALNGYLRIRRSLGFRLQQQENALRNFVAFLRAQGASYITTELALQWATQPAKVDPAQWAWRLGRVRRFAIWCSTTEPRTEIPPAGLLPHRRRRKPPYIYSDEEIKKLLCSTQQLSSRKGLRWRTFTTLFGLPVATGMRVNEALSLDQPDIDFDRGSFVSNGRNLGNRAMCQFIPPR